VPLEGPIYVGEDALGELVAYVRGRRWSHLAVVADENTWGALGQRAVSALSTASLSVHPIVLRGDVIADEMHIVQVMVEAGSDPEAYVVVGSGTLTDIVRFISHRCRLPFISLPTAPSVDAYTSPGAPLILRRLKRTLICKPPEAIFADLPTLCQAPHPMIAAGFGDMLAKFTCLADWELGHLLWDEPYNPDIASQTRRAVQRVTALAEEVGRAEPEAIQALTDGLLLSGLAMLQVGNSRPASGSEHHLSHFWEGKLLLEGRPPVLHGAKVGYGTLLIAGEYERLRGLSHAEIQKRLDADYWPSADAQCAQIRRAYGALADGVIASHEPFIHVLPERLAEVKRRVQSNWDRILTIAHTVPPVSQIQGWLEAAGAATSSEALGLAPAEVWQALEAAHYLRNRFTIRKLELLLGLSVNKEM